MSDKPLNPIQKLLEQKRAAQKQGKRVPVGDGLSNAFKPGAKQGLGPHWGGRNGNGKPS